MDRKRQWIPAADVVERLNSAPVDETLERDIYGADALGERVLDAGYADLAQEFESESAREGRRVRIEEIAQDVADRSAERNDRLG